MKSAQDELETAIRNTTFHDPVCPVYQNVDAESHSEVDTIKNNLVAQLTSPVYWMQSVQNMVVDGACEFIETGPGHVLRGLVRMTHRSATISDIESPGCVTSC